MKSIVSLTLVAALGMIFSPLAIGQKDPGGSVLKHSGESGDLIVSRDGIVYWLKVGDNLFERDILRAQANGSATITFNGCIYTLPEKKDVLLDDDFCVLAVAEEPTMAMIASETGTGSGIGQVLSQANAPLVIGGVVLSAGGIAATTGGGSGGTESTASREAGASPSSSGSAG